jgi:hypothetical protein
MRYAVHALRCLLGLDFLLNGINFFHPFLPITVPASVPARALMHGMVESGLFNIVKVVEIAGGLTLLSNRLVPLALLVLAPLTVVICYVDCFLVSTPEGFLFGGTTTVLLVLMLAAYLRHYLGVLAFRAGPSLPRAAEVLAALRGAGGVAAHVD